MTRAREAGLSGVLACGGGPDLDPGAIAAVRAFPGFAHLALGYGRDHAHENPSIDTLRDRIESLAAEGIRTAAIGEIGLDFSRGETPAERAAQLALFRAQLALAVELSLPCTIHSREATQETLDALRELPPEQNRRNILHCFVGDEKLAAEALALGCSFGISGIITFKSADMLRGSVRTMPRERVLLETDCPWLAPVPLRGKPNEPAYIKHTCATVASLWGITSEECAEITSENAMRIFSTGEK
ncbi:MAG: TatD family hydrolase [Kiritimatiellaeota bacterium]|nr:TatD family hydrolase [Kiritimatiellota bacterium]